LSLFPLGVSRTLPSTILRRAGINVERARQIGESGGRQELTGSGFGIRGTKQFTPLFEKLVNTISEKSPQSKLLFNIAPDNTLEAVRRWFPDL
jgi:hypothetical protein